MFVDACLCPRRQYEYFQEINGPNLVRHSRKSDQSHRVGDEGDNNVGKIEDGCTRNFGCPEELDTIPGGNNVLIYEKH